MSTCTVYRTYGFQLKEGFLQSINETESWILGGNLASILVMKEGVCGNGFLGLINTTDFIRSQDCYRLSWDVPGLGLSQLF